MPKHEFSKNRRYIFLAATSAFRWTLEAPRGDGRYSPGRPADDERGVGGAGVAVVAGRAGDRRRAMAVRRAGRQPDRQDPRLPACARQRAVAGAAVPGAPLRRDVVGEGGGGVLPRRAAQV